MLLSPKKVDYPPNIPVLTAETCRNYTDDIGVLT